jgi:hypothetical protein
MLASLEIISPQAFGVDILWRRYLGSCRIVFSTLGKGEQTPERARQQFFLARWYGYLDVMGSLSGPNSDPPLDFDVYWVADPAGTSDQDTIDCFLGCTRRCMRLLSEVAKLVKECQPTRLDARSRLLPRWSPPAGLERRARLLLDQLHISRQRTVSTCPHDVGGEASAGGNGVGAGVGAGSFQASTAAKIEEIRSTNLLYHWAGIIQLHRRVLNTAQDSDRVKEAVSVVLDHLETIRAGSPAEACLLFPIFAAGCETMDPSEQERFRRKIGDIEGFGMKQVSSSLVAWCWTVADVLLCLDHSGSGADGKSMDHKRALGKSCAGRVYWLNTHFVCNFRFELLSSVRKLNATSFEFYRLDC